MGINNFVEFCGQKGSKRSKKRGRKEPILGKYELRLLIVMCEIKEKEGKSCE